MKTVVGKVVVLGEPGVGKTSTITRYTQKSFNQHQAPTIGASFTSCKLQIDNVNVKLEIWDTAGQERFKAMAPMFYRNANAALLVFDITAPTTFESVKEWVRELKRNVEENMVLCVIGNKIDLVADRKISRDEALQYSKNIGANYFECSAKQDQGVGLIFEDIAVGLLRLLGNNVSHSLRVYDTENMDDIMANSSELDPTDIGKEEVVNLQKSNIAHGNSVKSNCC